MQLHSQRLIGIHSYRLIIPIAIALVAVASYATNVQVYTTAYQSQYGISYNVSASFTAIDQGFSTIAVSQAASTQPCLWINGTSCNTALTSNHVQFSLILKLKTPPILVTVFTLTVKWSQLGGAQTTMGQLTVSVSALATAGQQVTFQIDTGSSVFTTPLSVDVTVV
jgi:hypothetical protein